MSVGKSMAFRLAPLHLILCLGLIIAIVVIMVLRFNRLRKRNNALEEQARVYTEALEARQGPGQTEQQQPPSGLRAASPPRSASPPTPSNNNQQAQAKHKKEQKPKGKQLSSESESSSGSGSDTEGSVSESESSGSDIESPKAKGNKHSKPSKANKPKLPKSDIDTSDSESNSNDDELPPTSSHDVAVEQVKTFVQSQPSKSLKPAKMPSTLPGDEDVEDVVGGVVAATDEGSDGNDTDGGLPPVDDEPEPTPRRSGRARTLGRTH